MTKDDGGPAFPVNVGDAMDAGEYRADYRGVSMRDYFAAAALQGILAYSHVNPSLGNFHENCTPAQAARTAYYYADAMLAERAQ